MYLIELSTFLLNIISPTNVYYENIIISSNNICLKSLLVYTSISSSNYYIYFCDCKIYAKHCKTFVYK